MKNLIKNVLLVSLPSVIMFFVAGELLFRFSTTLRDLTTPPEFRKELHQYSDNVNLFAPNLDTKIKVLGGEFEFEFKTNAFGLRSKPIQKEKTEGLLRILCVGDSFTEGYGVHQEETFANQLDAMLNGVGVKAEVLTAARSGKDIWDYASLLRYYGDLLNPDIVIVGVYSGNDITNFMVNASEFKGRVSEVVAFGFLIPEVLSENFRANTEFGAVYAASGWGWLVDIDHWFWQKLRFYRFISDRVTQSSFLAQILAKVGVVEIREKIEPRKMPVINPNKDLYASKGTVADVAKIMFDSAETAYKDMVDYTREKGIKMAVLNIPEGWQHPPSSYETPDFDESHDPQKVHGFFIEQNETHNIPYKNLLTAYRDGYYKGDYSVFTLTAAHGHFSAKDNTLVALILLDLLNQKKWVTIDNNTLTQYYQENFPDVRVPFAWAQSEQFVPAFDRFEIVDCYDNVLSYEEYRKFIKGRILTYNSFPPNGRCDHIQYLRTNLVNRSDQPKTFRLQFVMKDDYNAGNHPGKIQYHVYLGEEKLWHHDASIAGFYGWLPVEQDFTLDPGVAKEIRIVVYNGGCENWDWGKTMTMVIKDLVLREIE